MWNEGSQRRINSKTAVILAIVLLSIAAFLLAILALVAGQNPHRAQQSPILTFDTSAVNADILNYLDAQSGAGSYSTLSSKVYGWYEVHYLSVCKGMWHNGVVGVKDDSTTTCEPKSAGYSFSLAAELAADATPAAQNLFTNWSYGNLQTVGSAVLLAIGIGFLGLSVLAYMFSLATRSTIEPGTSLFPLRIAFLSSIITAILLINSAAQITAMANKLTNLANWALPVSLQVWKSNGFYVFVWLSVSLTWVVVAVGTGLGLALGGQLTHVSRDPLRSDGDLRSSTWGETPKEVF